MLHTNLGAHRGGSAGGGGGRGGGEGGSGTPTFGGPPKDPHKDKKQTLHTCVRKRHVLVLNSYPDPPFRDPVSAPGLCK